MWHKTTTASSVFMFAVWIGALPGLMDMVTLREYRHLAAAVVLGLCLHATTRVQFHFYRLNLEPGIVVAGSVAAVAAGWTAWWVGPDRIDRSWLSLAMAAGVSQLLVTVWVGTRRPVPAEPPRPRRVEMVDKNLDGQPSHEDALRASERQYLERELALMKVELETLPDRIGADAHKLGQLYVLMLELSRLSATLTADSLDAHRPQLAKIHRWLGELRQHFGGTDPASLAVQDLTEHYLQAADAALKPRPNITIDAP